MQVRRWILFYFLCILVPSYSYHFHFFVLQAYLGIKIFRFYFRCSRCSQEITIKTDPKNADYVTELGCSRNFEAKKEEAAIEAEETKKRKEEEEGNAMKQLENKTLDSRREMEIADALDDLRSHNARLQRVAMDDSALLELVHQKAASDAAAARAADVHQMQLDDEDLEAVGGNVDGLTVEDIALLKQMRDKQVGKSYRPVLSSSLRKAAPSFDDDEDDFDDDDEYEEDDGNHFVAPTAPKQAAPLVKPAQQPSTMFSSSKVSVKPTMAPSQPPQSSTALSALLDPESADNESGLGGLVDYD
jgi:hypothetical protein